MILSRGVKLFEIVIVMFKKVRWVTLVKISEDESLKFIDKF